MSNLLPSCSEQGSTCCWGELPQSCPHKPTAAPALWPVMHWSENSALSEGRWRVGTIFLLPVTQGRGHLFTGDHSLILCDHLQGLPHIPAGYHLQAPRFLVSPMFSLLGPRSLQWSLKSAVLCGIIEFRSLKKPPNRLCSSSSPQTPMKSDDSGSQPGLKCWILELAISPRRNLSPHPFALFSVLRLQ